MRIGWALVALMVSCGTGWQPNPTHNYHVQISPAFTIDQSTAIMNGVLVWQERSNGFVTFDGDPTATTDVITIDLGTAQTITKEFGGGVIGETTYEGVSSRIALTSTLDPSLFAQTVQHEIGHALGLKHTIAGTIMCADTGCAAQTVTCADVARLEEGTTYSCDDVN
jgi:predicted Zn-dependent protease